MNLLTCSRVKSKINLAYKNQEDLDENTVAQQDQQDYITNINADIESVGNINNLNNNEPKQGFLSPKSVINKAPDNLSGTSTKVNKNCLLPFHTPQNSLFFCNENYYVLTRLLFCIYERVNKLFEFSLNSVMGNQISPSVQAASQAKSSIDYLSLYIVIFKIYVHKEAQTSVGYEELCRDIFGNEYYYLSNMDKIMNSCVKCLQTVFNDNMSKSILSLKSTNERIKADPFNENIYLAEYCKLIERSSNTAYRIVFSRSVSVLSINLVELNQNLLKSGNKNSFSEFSDKKKYEDKYKNLCFFINSSLNEFVEIDKSTSLKRCRRMNRNLEKGIIINSSGLTFYSTPRGNLRYSQHSGADYLVFKKKQTPEIQKKKMLTLFKKNLDFKKWHERRLLELENSFGCYDSSNLNCLNDVRSLNE